MAAFRPEPGADEPGADPSAPAGPSAHEGLAAVEGKVPAGRVARTGRRVARATVVARDASVAALVTAVTPVVRAVGALLSVVLALISVPAVLLLVVAWWRPGPGDWFWTLVALAGMGIGGWLLHRRRQLVATVADRERLVTALTRVLTARDIADRLTGNLTGAGALASSGRPAPDGALASSGRPAPDGALASSGRPAPRALRGSRGLRLLRGMWHGVQLTGVVDTLFGTEEIAPLTPGRLRGLGVLTVVSAVAAGVLWVALVLATLAFLAGA